LYNVVDQKIIGIRTFSFAVAIHRLNVKKLHNNFNEGCGRH